MNRTKLKNYAPQARRDFIQATVDRAAYYGVTAKKTEPVVEKGDVAVIGGLSFPIAIAKKRKALEDRINRHGFEQTMEAMAYTWFNRLVAIRFMELHGYLEHGYRVLSHPEGKPTPEILEHAEHVELPDLKKEAVIDLKLAGNKEGELYRLLLTAQCNALNTAMPFLFERIDDETELLLPDNLLNSDSLMRKLVGEIEEEDWNEVEIIGWLYQFYISEKKDEVIGKVVASEDIPAATQLFTPNWIVKYLVHNTLGRQWLATYPQSALRQQMEYYIEPAEQTPAVQEQLKAITPTSLNPEELTLLDPACGSGHILVEAYDLFKAIYQERGYRAKDIPALILQKNLYGMEIDDRAAQLAAFALMMKAHADDRRIFDSEAKPNILVFEDSQGMNANEIAYALNAPINKDDVPNEYLFEEIQKEKDGLFSKKALAEKGYVSQGDIAALLELFENAKTFGSLIQVPPKLAAKLPEIEKRLDEVLTFGDLTHASAHVLKPLLQQARLLERQYDVVIANPPFMGSKWMNSAMKTFAKNSYPTSQMDVFAMFFQSIREFAKPNHDIGVVSPFVWMFLSSYESVRSKLFDAGCITSLIQLEYNAFEPACVPVCVFTLKAHRIPDFKGEFIKLSEFRGHESQAPRALAAICDKHCHYRYRGSTSDFEALPARPVSYWLSERVRNIFKHTETLGNIAKPSKGFDVPITFFRLWHEVNETSVYRLGRQLDHSRWVEVNKGGSFRRWYGNRENIVTFSNNGQSLYSIPGANIRNKESYFKPGITYSVISSSSISFRESFPEAIFYAHGSTCTVADHELRMALLALCNSSVSVYVLGVICPTLTYQVGDVAKLPVRLGAEVVQRAAEIARKCVSLSRQDVDDHETSWEFARHPLVSLPSGTCESMRAVYVEQCTRRVEKLTQLQNDCNKLFIETYGLDGEISSEVPNDQINIYRPDREEDIKRLLSYAIGCIMGRYSLDKPGVIYAHSGNQEFDASQYRTFRADDDGIIPLLETDWGIRDDATNRFVEFVGAAWPKEHLEENLKFVADSLGPTASEQSRETIRRYLATGFYKHHLPMYKKRPIYWLFSSGKQRAFQCLVYLHRYHEGTLARMRTEYVIPFQGQIAARIEQLEGDKAKATSTSHRNKLQKQQNDLKKQETELRTFEEKLKHAADQKISLDLDDGVKANYAKFGDLLAESKAITGGKDDE